MIEHNRSGEHELSCDGCGVSEEPIKGWEELMAHMSAEGWKKRRLGDERAGTVEWLHFCGGCVADKKHMEVRHGGSAEAHSGSQGLQLRGRLERRSDPHPVRLSHAAAGLGAVMAETTEIIWTDATVNFWWGCTKVGPGCDFCYAEAWSKRTGGDHWGVGVPRRKIKSAVALMKQLDNEYAAWAADATVAIHNARAFSLPVPAIGLTRRVFVQSMADIFDLEAPLPWFDEAWRTIEACRRIEVQLVTKRISVVKKRLAEIGVAAWPRHAGLIISIVNQAEADRDIPRLLELFHHFDIPWIGLSCEPLLGGIVLPPEFLALGKRAWVIAGGESGAKARCPHPDWFLSLRDQCARACVPFLFKQWGEWAPAEPIIGKHIAHAVASDGALYKLSDLAYPDGPRRGEAVLAGHDKVQLTAMYRIGKKAAGNLLDGRQHLEFPR
jgi:protein gp37